MSLLALRKGIDMDGDKQISLVLVGNFRTTVQLHTGIRLAGVNHLHVRAVLFYQSTKGQGKLQCQVFFLDLAITNGTRVTTTMTGIYHEREVILRSHDTNRPKQSYTYYYIP